MSSKSKVSSMQPLLGAAITAISIIVLASVARWLLKDISPELRVTLIVAVLTVGATLWTTRSTKLKDRELQIQAQQSAKREEVVTRFMENIWELMKNKNWSADENQKHIEKTLKDFMVNGSLWLSDETVKTFVDYRLAAQNGATEKEVVVYLARLMLSFRKDLGHDNKTLSEKDMLDVFLNDTGSIFKD